LQQQAYVGLLKYVTNMNPPYKYANKRYRQSIRPTTAIDVSSPFEERNDGQRIRWYDEPPKLEDIQRSSNAGTSHF
jgi:hypothetical protein